MRPTTGLLFNVMKHMLLCMFHILSPMYFHVCSARICVHCFEKKNKECDLLGVTAVDIS